MVELCDGWMPLATRMDIVGEVGRVRQAVADAGRDPASFEIIAYGAKPDQVDTLMEAGIDHTIFNLRLARPRRDSGVPGPAGQGITACLK